MTQISIHIDGGYFLKELSNVRPDFTRHNIDDTLKGLNWLVSGHLKKLNEIYCYQNEKALLYRIFYYDAVPYDGRDYAPISNEVVNFSTSPEALFRKELFARLRRQRNFALRLGTVYRESKWTIKPHISKKIQDGDFDLSTLQDEDFRYGFRQKGVDMRLGLDIAAVVLKKQADIIILVTGDSDFIPISKLARREGAQVILDTMWRSASPDLFEHIDGLHNGLGKTTRT